LRAGPGDLTGGFVEGFEAGLPFVAGALPELDFEAGGLPFPVFVLPVGGGVALVEFLESFAGIR
jgi:hypothetical protein